MEYVNRFHSTGFIAGGFMAKDGAVVTIATQSGQTAFIKVKTNLTSVPANGTRVEVSGYVSRRRGYDKNKNEYFAQCFIATDVAAEKTLSEKESGVKGTFYDTPQFNCTIEGKVLTTVEKDNYINFLVQTKKPNKKNVSLWLSTKKNAAAERIKEGDNASFVTGVYTKDRKHETLTVRDCSVVKSGETEDSDTKKGSDTRKKKPTEKAGKAERADKTDSIIL